MDARTVIRLLWELYVTNVAERAEQREKRRFGHLCVEAACVSRAVTYPTYSVLGIVVGQDVETCKWAFFPHGPGGLGRRC